MIDSNTAPPRDASHTTIPDVSFLGPDRVLDAAYALHVVDSASPEEREREIYHMAKHIIDDFHRLYEGVEHGGAEWVFLYSVQQIMVSLAKGIGRRKRILEERIAAAKEKRDRRLKAISSNTIKMGLLKACWRVLLWGGLGYLLTHSMLPNKADMEKASPAYASLAAAIAFVLIGTFIRARVTSAHYNGIYNGYESDQLRAQAAYNEGALEEYRRAKRDAARVWEHYTHKKPTEWLAFDAVLAEDLAHVQDLCERDEEDKRVLRRWFSPITHWVTKYMTTLKKKRQARQDRDVALTPPSKEPPPPPPDRPEPHHVDISL